MFCHSAVGVPWYGRRFTTLSLICIQISYWKLVKDIPFPQVDSRIYSFLGLVGAKQWISFGFLSHLLSTGICSFPLTIFLFPSFFLGFIVVYHLSYFKLTFFPYLTTYVAIRVCFADKLCAVVTVMVGWMFLTLVVSRAVFPDVYFTKLVSILSAAAIVV